MHFSLTNFLMFAWILYNINMNGKYLGERLLDLPALIAENQRKVLDQNGELQLVSNNIVEIETKIKLSIAAKVDDAGKKVYSNADAREAAFAEAAAGDFELIELKDSRDKKEKSLQLLKIEYEQLSNEQRNLRAMLYFLAGKSE